MAITIDGQIYRNLQEQVQYLTDLTADIKPYVAGTGIIISGQTISVDPSINEKITEVEGVAVTANNNAMTAQSTANSAKTNAEQASTKAEAAKTQAASALQTANAAQAAATLAQNRADSAYNLANTANTASQQNASRIQIIEDTAPQFSLEGTTLMITLPE